MSNHNLSEVGSTSQLRPLVEASQANSSENTTTIPAPEESKTKGIFVNIGGRLRTISDTTLNLLQNGSQLDITTHLMDKKLVGGYSSKQLEIAVAHAREDKQQRIAKASEVTERELSAEKALEEAVKKYGEEAEASVAHRTISEILLQYSSKTEDPSLDSASNSSEISPTTPPISANGDSKPKPSSQTSSRTSSPAKQKAQNRDPPSKQKPPNRFQILQQPFSSRIQGGFIRTTPKSRLSPSFSPVKSPSRLVAPRLANSSSSGHSIMSRTVSRSSMESTRSSNPKRRVYYDGLSKFTASSHHSSNKPFRPGYGLSLMPPPPKLKIEAYSPDYYARMNMRKPPVPRQHVGASHSTSRSKQSYSQPSRETPRPSRPEPSVHAQRYKRSVGPAGERPNRFFHGEIITDEVRASRKNIKYTPEDPEYRTITDPTYGRYRHFYMGMMERLPAGYPVSLRNYLFPLPPPPTAPSLMRYRNPLKIPLRKVGFEKDDFLTKSFPVNAPYTIKPTLPIPRIYTYTKPPVPSFRQALRADTNNHNSNKGPHETRPQTPPSSSRPGSASSQPDTGPQAPLATIPEENFWDTQEKRRAERGVWAERMREVVRLEREFVEAYKPYFRQEEEDEEYRQYDMNFEEGPRALLMKLLEEHIDKTKSKTSAEEEDRLASLKEPTSIPTLEEARLRPYRYISENDYRWSLQECEEGLNHQRRYVNWRECDLHDVYDMRCILEVYGLLDILPYLKYDRQFDMRSTTMGTVEFIKGSVYIKGFENILLTVVNDMTYGKADKKRLGRYFGRNALERASVRQWLTFAMNCIRSKSLLGEDLWTELECHLERHNFFATSFYSVADVMMYVSLYPFFKPLEREQREKYPFIADFIRTIQRDENVLRANKRLMIRNWDDIHILNRPSR